MDKQEAINQAKEAMFKNLAFAISASPAQADKLKSASYKAAKEAVTLRKTLVGLVAKFKVLAGTVKAIASTLSKNINAESKVTRIASIIKSQGNAYKLAEELQEEKGSVSATAKSFLTSTKSALKGVAGLMLGLTALLVPSIRKELVKIFEGLLSGFGVSTEQINKLKVIAAGIVTALGTYYSIMVFNRVVTAFKKLRDLAVVTGLLAEATAAANGIELPDFERRTYGGDKDKLSPERRSEIEELEKKRKEGKDPVREKRLKRVKQLKKLKNIISFGSRLLKFTGVGFLTGVAIEAVGGTLIDIASADDDVEINPENTLKMAVNNVIEAATFGTVKDALKIEKTDGKKITPTVEVDVKDWHETPKAAPVPQMPAQEIKSKSEQVVRQGTDVAMNNSGITVVNVDNSQTNIGMSKSQVSNEPLIYSTGVGK